MKPAKILFIEDDEVERRAFLWMVRDKALPWDLEMAETLAGARAHLAESRFDAIVANYRLPDGESTELFDEIPDTPFVLVTGTLEEQLALRTLERGADHYIIEDYVIKDVEHRHLEALPFAVEKTLYRKALQETEQQLTRQLRASEERLAAFMKHLPGAAWIKDLDGRYVSINSEAERIFGISSGLLRGKMDDDIFPPETARQFQENDRRVLAEGCVLRTIEVLHQSDGLDHLSIVRKFALAGPAGQPAYIAGVAFDITERMQAEEALRESERRLRATFENAASGIVQTDSQDRFVAVNDRLCQMLGYSREELLGKSVHDLTHPEDRPRSDDLNAQLHEGPLPWVDYEKRYLKRDGSALWVHMAVSAVRDQAGRYLYSVGTVVDISARKAAEAQVALLAAALEAAPNAVSVSQTNSEGTIVWVNPAFTRLTGYSTEEAVGQSHHMLSSGQQDEAFYRNLWETIKKGDTWRGELVNRRKDGTLYHEEMGITPLCDEHGNVTHYVAIKQDITARKEAAQKLKESEEALRRRVTVDEAIMANMGEGLFTVDTDGLVTYVNSAAEHLFGFSSAELIGRKMHDMTHYNHPDGTPFPIEECPGFQVLHRGATLTNYEDIFIRKNGEFFPVVYSSAPIQLNGRAVGLVVVFRDVTAQKQAEAALHREQAQLRQITGTMEAGVTRCSRDLQYLWVSPAYARWIGLKPEEIEGRPIVEMIGVQGYEDIRPYVERVLSGESVEYEATVDFLRPGRRWINARYAPTHDHNGIVDGWVAVVTDITARKEAEEKLQESEERFRTLADALPVLIWQCNADLYCDYFNKGWLEFTGRTLEQEGGSGWAMGVHPEDKQRCLEIFGSAAARRESFEMEYRLRHHSGEYRWILDRGTPRFDSHGTFLGYLGGCVDISDRKRSEEVLRESEQRLRLAQEVAKIGTFDWDIRTGVNVWTPQLEAMYGLPPGSFPKTQSAWEKYIHPEDRAETVRKVESAFATGQPVEAEWRIIWPDGSVHWITGRWQVFKDEWGKPLRMSGVNIEITDRKRAEEEAASARRIAEQAKAAAETANRAKDHFLAVLSHELRTPLTPVVMGLSILENRLNLDPEMRETLEMVRRNVDMEARLIDDLLDVTRIARGKIDLNRSRVEVCRVIQRAVEVCKPDLEARRLHFGVDLGPAAPYWVEADVPRLQQVFWNLIKNSIKFTPRGGCVGVRCRPEKQRVLIEVNDSGIGIDPDSLEMIFNAFEQVEKSKNRQFGGLGLGLAISKALVEMHGGEIEAHSEGRGKGATFRVHLPLSVPVTEQPETLQASAPTQQFTRPLRILLVEDHGVTAQMIRVVLTEKGHTVEIAGDVSTGLDLADHRPFDLLLSDLGLPDGSGYELIHELRMRGHVFPGIALSGYGQEEDIYRSYEAGFATHLTKPASRETIIDAIAAVAGGNGHSERDSSPVHRADTPVFDPDTALKRCFGKREFLSELINAFPQESGELISLIRGALDREDFAELGRAAHRLKGSLVYLGAQPATDAASEVEQDAKLANSKTAAEAVSKLERQLELLKGVLASKKV